MIANSTHRRATGFELDVDDVRWMLARAADGLPQDAMVELVGVSFLADEESILGRVDRGYVARELAWYESRSLRVRDMPGGAPKIWEQVADEWGWVNSNYGYLLTSPDNYSQFDRVVSELRRDPSSRRALAIYTRPTMHTDSVANGMQDFVCTNAVQYLVRDERVHAVVQMRSNDAVFGYRNDLAWQRHALGLVSDAVGVGAGTITWQVGSLHVYPRHRWLLDGWSETGEWDVPVARKKEEK